MDKQLLRTLFMNMYYTILQATKLRYQFYMADCTCKNLLFLHNIFFFFTIVEKISQYVTFGDLNSMQSSSSTEVVYQLDVHRI